MSNFEAGWKMYAAGQKMIAEAKGWPKIVAQKVKNGTLMLIEGAKLANTPDEVIV